MRFQVNLASKPFQNRSLFWITIFIVLGVVAMVGLDITASSAEYSAREQSLKEDVDIQRRQIEDLKARQPKFQPVPVSQQDYQMLLSANELVERKALSWTWLLSDLERIVPHDVRVLSIAVARAADDKGERRGSQQQAVDWLSRKVPLTLIVATKDDHKITGELLPLLNKESPRYRAFVTEQQPQPETGETLFKIAIDFTPPFANAAPAAPPQGGQQ
ncbi:MAG TPA: hypothetical protein VFC63_12400 [Blastocatellia bacterium]|nr:hypothetical protein [Blastocatellia bacterium]